MTHMKASVCMTSCYGRLFFLSGDQPAHKSIWYWHFYTHKFWNATNEPKEREKSENRTHHSYWCANIRMAVDFDRKISVCCVFRFLHVIVIRYGYGYGCVSRSVVFGRWFKFSGSTENHVWRCCKKIVLIEFFSSNRSKWNAKSFTEAHSIRLACRWLSFPSTHQFQSVRAV